MPDESRSPLLKDVSQFEVDFVIPRLGVDLPLAIDPFLLFKSRDPDLSKLHGTILRAFNSGIEHLRQGRTGEAQRLLDFPEVPEIGLGHTKKGKRGSGVGTYLTDLILESLRESPVLMERGVRHVEEMQLVSIGIGPDRISDIAANILKRYLIEYTQRQCALWSIPLTRGVPVSHVLDPETLDWEDGFFDLPLSPSDLTPIILVPRRIVRTIPWINYEDFFRMEFAAYLRAKRVKGRLSQPSKETPKESSPSKSDVVAVTRFEVERIDKYISQKEDAAADAQPSLSYLSDDDACAEAEELKRKLAAILPGRAQASDYQRAVLAVLNYLFNPELIDGEMEVRTIDGTERRDIVFTNDSDKSFWSYIRAEHSSIFLMFETKNMEEVEAPALNQTATYLGDRLGRLGFIVTRNALGEAQIKKGFSIYNDSHPRKVILTLSDADLRTMLDMKCKGQDPMRHLQKAYRAFRTSVQ